MSHFVHERYYNEFNPVLSERLWLYDYHDLAQQRLTKAAARLVQWQREEKRMEEERLQQEEARREEARREEARQDEARREEARRVRERRQDTIVGVATAVSAVAAVVSAVSMFFLGRLSRN
jgi:isoaspartyl peptidase/L-asparaginase-like protein (Ntn-hydrolase superfamily)